MTAIAKMYDIDGTEVGKGDFVQLVEGKPPYINRAMKKGIVLKVSYMEDRGFSKDGLHMVAFLTGKGNSGRIYSNGVTSSEIRKVNYDLKKRKIID